MKRIEFPGISEVPFADDQDFFNRSVAHLRKQGRPCAVNGQCAQRALAEDGQVLACAVGGVVPDRLIEAVREAVRERDTSPTGGYGFGFFRASQDPEVDRFFCRVNRDLVLEMQALHDNYPQPEWEELIAKTAMQRGLTLPEVAA